MSWDHYVSKGIINQFRFNDTQVYYLRKGGDSNIEPRNPRSIFSKSKLNPVKVEYYLSNEFDDKIVRIISSVKECLQKRGRLEIGADVHEWLVGFVAVQIRRDPNFLLREDFIDRTRSIVANVIISDVVGGAEVNPSDIPLVFQEIERGAAEYIGELRISVLPMTYSFLGGRRFVFATSRDGGGEFIIGSRPVVFLDGGASEFREIWMPIAPDLALGSLAPCEPGPIVTLPKSYIDRINQAIFSRSEAVASRRSDLLEALVSGRKQLQQA